MIYSTKILIKYLLVNVNKIYFETMNEKHYIKYKLDLLYYTVGG